MTSNIIMYDAALEYVRAQLAADRQESDLVQLNVTVGPSSKEVLDQLSADLGWTKRKVIETAVAALNLMVEQVGDRAR